MVEFKNPWPCWMIAANTEVTLGEVLRWVCSHKPQYHEDQHYFHLHAAYECALSTSLRRTEWSVNALERHYEGAVNVKRYLFISLCYLRFLRYVCCI